MILCVGDLHLADTPPSSCTDSYTDDLFDLLDQVQRVTNLYEAQVVLVGDIFHHKAPSRTSHALVQRFMSWCRSLPSDPWIVVGNHDITSDRMDTLDRQPLGSVFEAGLARAGTDPVPCRDGSTLDFIPWQQNWDEWLDGPVCTGKVAGVTVAHAPLYPPGTEPFWESVDARRFADRVSTTHVYYGHVHDYHGQWEAGGVKFCNVGALSRGSLSESDMTRKIKVALFNNSRFKEITLRHKPASEVFRVDEVMGERHAKLALEEFISTAGTTELRLVTIEDVVAAVAGMDNIDQPVKDAAIELLEAQ